MPNPKDMLRLKFDHKISCRQDCNKIRGLAFKQVFIGRVGVGMLGASAELGSRLLVPRS